MRTDAALERIVRLAKEALAEVSARSGEGSGIEGPAGKLGQIREIAEGLLGSGTGAKGLSFATAFEVDAGHGRLAG